MQVAMVALARFIHEGRRLNIGEEFQTDRDNALDLKALELAKPKQALTSIVRQGVTRGAYKRREE